MEEVEDDRRWWTCRSRTEDEERIDSFDKSWDKSLLCSSVTSLVFMVRAVVVTALVVVAVMIVEEGAV